MNSIEGFGLLKPVVTCSFIVKEKQQNIVVQWYQWQITEFFLVDCGLCLLDD